MLRLLLVAVWATITVLPQLSGQIKHDNIWIMGYPTAGVPDPLWGGTLIKFDTMPPETQYFNIPFELNASATICDAFGSLLFYTNNCEIANRQHQIMKNGSGLNVGGYAHWNTCQREGGYPTHQGALILPWPGKTDQYFLFHLHRPGQTDQLIRRLLYTKVDMRGDGGLGEVVEKNTEAWRDTFTDQMTAVRHANGRDWWIVLAKYNALVWFSFLVSPQGIAPPIVQRLKASGIPNWGIGMQATFSPNGKWYINCNHTEGLQIFPFDRCSGRLSNPVIVDWLPEDQHDAVGVAVSPSSRYIYARGGRKNLYQFDLNADTIAHSRILVDSFDGYSEYGVPITFYQLMTAPNGKIYMTATNGVRYLHVINSPNLAGRDCNFVQRGLPLKGFNGPSLPNFPHFRLFDVPGSVCDTLGIDGKPTPDDTLRPIRLLPRPCEGDFSLWPNPASVSTLLVLPACGVGRVDMYDAVGRLVLHFPIPAGSRDIPIEVLLLPAGLYFLQVRTQNGGRVVKPLAVVR